MNAEAAAGVATGAVIAGAIEKPVAHSKPTPDHAHCSDCGAPVTSKFCSECGQSTHAHRTLMHLMEEFLHGVLHFDGRIWRTLPMLFFRPGTLTRNWIDGKRTRYVSPLALFLFTIFLLFFIFSFAGGVNDNRSAPIERLEALRGELVEAQTRLATIEKGDPPTAEPVTAAASVAASSRGPEVSVGVQVDTNSEALTPETARTAVSRIEEQIKRLETDIANGRKDGLEPGSWQAMVADAVEADNVTVNLGTEEMNEAVLKKLKNPDFALYKLQQTAYKLAFLLVPLSIPFVALLFLWKRGFTLYDHGVFVLYSMTFIAIGFVAIAAFGGTSVPLLGTAASAVLIAMPVHMFFQLKGTYRLSAFSALWRTSFLLLFAICVLSMFLMAILVAGLAV